MSVIVFSSLLFAAILLLIINTALTMLHAPGREKTLPLADPSPRVTILVPAKNVEANSDAVLSSLFSLDYPDYEIIFGVDLIGDPISGLIQTLMGRYPDIPARIVETGQNKSGNPKISTLCRMHAEASGSLLWVCDANVLVQPHTLSRLVHEQRAHASGIVFSLIGGDCSATFGSMLENAYLNSFVTGNIVMAWTLARKPIIVGKSMLINRDALIAQGGFERYQSILAEDYCMGDDYARAGLPVTTNYTWVFNCNSNSSVNGFFGRAARWAALRWHINHGTYILELLTNPLLLAALGTLCIGPAGLPALAMTWLIKIIAEFFVLLTTTRHDRINPKVVLLFPWVVTVKDILLGIVFFTPFFSATVNWRGRRIKIGRRSVIINEAES